MESPRTPGEAQAPEGRYANHFNVGHNAIEFLFDFGQFFSEDKQWLHTRIIVTPVVAKAFRKVLDQAVKAFEKKHGNI